MFGNSRLINRIFWVVSISSIGFFLGLSITVYVNAQNSLKLAQNTKIITNNILEVKDFINDLDRLAQNLRGYVLFPDKQQFRQSYAAEFKLFEKKLANINSLYLASNDPEVKPLLKQFIDEAETFFNQCEDVIRLLEDNKVEAARQLTEQLTMKEIDRLGDNLTENIINNYLENHQKLADAHQFMLGVGVVGTGVSIPLVILVALGISFQLKNQSLTGKAGAEYISENNLIDPQENSQISAISEAITHLNGRHQFNSAILEGEHSVTQIARYSTAIASSSQELEGTCRKQLASINQVVAIAQDIALKSEELYQTINEVTSLYDLIANAARSGDQDLLKVEKTISQFAQSMTGISAKIGLISEKVHNINTMVTTISQMADRTNLLSLNAAIKAEKAGAYGEDFAWVGREIRRLADQSAVASLDMEAMVKDMQLAVSSGVMEMEKFTKEVNETIKNFRNISQQFNQIVEPIANLNPRWQAMSQDMASQTQAANQVSAEMTLISEGSLKMADSLRQLNLGIQELNESAQRLHREIYR